MKYIKMLGLLAVAAAALMAFAGSASATLTGLNANKEIHAKNEGAVTLRGGSTTITCNTSTVGGIVDKNEANHVTSKGELSTLTFTNCNHTVTVITNGTLTATDTGSNTADVYSDEAEVTVLAHVFLLGTVHCTYVTNDTTIGTLTGSGHAENETTTATFDISAQIEKDPTTSDPDFCSDLSTWEGSYEVTEPDHLTIH